MLQQLKTQGCSWMLTSCQPHRLPQDDSHFHNQSTSGRLPLPQSVHIRTIATSTISPHQDDCHFHSQSTSGRLPLPQSFHIRTIATSTNSPHQDDCHFHNQSTSGRLPLPQSVHVRTIATSNQSTSGRFPFHSQSTSG